MEQDAAFDALQWFETVERELGEQVQGVLRSHGAAASEAQVCALMICSITFHLAARPDMYRRSDVLYCPLWAFAPLVNISCALPPSLVSKLRSPSSRCSCVHL